MTKWGRASHLFVVFLTNWGNGNEMEMKRRERQTHRQTDRQAGREREREREQISDEGIVIW